MKIQCSGVVGVYVIDTMMKTLLYFLGFFTLIFFSSGSQAACPNLSGNYICPARKTQPSSPMVVTQSEDASSVTTYSYLFQFSPTPALSRASEKGEFSDGFIYSCDKDGLWILPEILPEKTIFQRHFLNEHGDYVVTLGNSHTPSSQDPITMKCIRQD